MKKFYTLIFGAVFLSISFLSHAQTWTSIANNNTVPGGPFTLDDVRFWVSPPGGIAPPNPCNLCTIVINSDVKVVPDDGTSSAFAAGTAPQLNDVQLTNSTLQINAAVTVTINTYLQLTNTQVLIGSDATTFAKVILNNQVQLNDVASTIQLANVNTSVDARNTIGEPILGPYTSYTSATKIAGIYFKTPTDPKGYDFTLSNSFIGNSTNTGPPGPANLAFYLLNCNGNGPANSNTCGLGLLFGPATTSFDAVNNYLTFGQSTTLPVVLVQFLATKNADATIKLSWATAQEINSSSFDVERSADQGSWEKIGSVKAKGYSSITANYSYTDQFPLAGNNYYRLKMIDLDGKFNYSKVVAVSADKDSRPLVIYSNPFSDQIRVKVNVSRGQNLVLTVSDIIGKTYLKQSYSAQAGDNLINLAPAGAASGMYVLHIQGNTYDQTVKLAKQ